VFLETGAGWVPYMMDRLQASYEMFTLTNDRLDQDPQDYVRGGQLYFATEPDEAIMAAVADIVGADQLVLGSDYCHPEGMCPFTMKVLAERSDIGEDLKRKILSDNPARLYGL
jgi:predicted TIM-barrel fold metal-dependent hydrolase